MKFCDKDGGLLVPDKSGNKKLICINCGKKYPLAKEKVILKEEIKNKERVEVVDSDVEINPKIDIECPNCGHGKAFFWSLQTRAADEGETSFYKCTKCNHKWRKYD
ncbi:transcription factor S [Candidatus Woesearchaeota archaeon]|nr:transcription factor S [Candidatus Woesearchaeota archaeon]